MAADEPIELGYYGAVIRRQIGLIIVVGIVCALLAAVLFGGTRYRSTAEVLIHAVPSTGGTLEAEEINTLTEQQIASSAVLAERVATELEADDPEFLLDQLSVEVPLDTQTLAFHFTARNRERAQDGAQAFAEAYLRFREDTAATTRDERVQDLTTQIADRTAQLGDVSAIINAAAEGGDDAPSDIELARAQARREQLLSDLAALNADLSDWSSLRINAGSILREAKTATPAQTSRFLLLFAGGIVGLVLGTALAFAVDRIRARINSPADLEAELDAPVLATIPAVARSSQAMVTRTEPNTPAAHAYRRLAVTLLSGATAAPRSVLIVSPTKNEPRTAVALNLSIALIQQGRRVVLVSGDRHDPRIDRTFGLSGPGLDEYLAGRGTIEPYEVLRGLFVLPAGDGIAFPIHHVPPRAAMTAVIERAMRLADIVLVDAPRALDYPDAEVIGQAVDAVLVVAAAERTTRGQTADLRGRLALVSAHVRGAVLVRHLSLRQRLNIVRQERAAVAARRPEAAPTVPPLQAKPEPEPQPEQETEPEVEVEVAVEESAAPWERQPDDLKADAAALRERIDALLRRHTSVPINGNGEPVGETTGEPDETRSRQ
jgi:Mrp family chromosome partitioning ATPase